MVLPAIALGITATTIIVVLIAIFIIALLTIFVPDIGNFFWIVGLGVGAYLTKDVDLYKSPNLTLTLGGLVGIVALGMLLIHLFGVNFQGFGAAIFGMTGTSGFISDFFGETGIEPESFFSILAITVGMIAGIITISSHFKKQKFVRVK